MQDRLIRELINRLARLDAAAGWEGDLNPSQRAVLDYLGRANRFSRSPSQVAEYLGTTRGTISQTLKSLGQKGYVSEQRSTTDKRAIRFDLTEKGRSECRADRLLSDALAHTSPDLKQALTDGLSDLLTRLVGQNNGKPFGVCKTCRHFSKRPGGGFCNLLSEVLSADETSKICHEQVPL
ncbi:MAG: MarR family transcriptional regulator [Pseudomonadota bacterium]